MSRSLTRLLEGRGYTEGPAVLPDGRVALTSMGEGRVLILDGAEVVAEVVTGGGPTGLLSDGEGALLIAQNNGQWGAPSDAEAVLMKWNASGLQPFLDHPLVAPNDLCFGPDRNIYVTDPLTERALDSAVQGRVFRIDSETREATIISDDILFPNGIAWSHDGQLVVAETFTSRIVELDPRTGATSTIAETVDGRPDGLAFDMEGNLWVAVNASDSVQVFDRSGQMLERLDLGMGSYPSNLCFEGTRLIVTTAGYGGATAVEVGVSGLPLHTGPSNSEGTGANYV